MPASSRNARASNRRSRSSARIDAPARRGMLAPELAQHESDDSAAARVPPRVLRHEPFDSSPRKARSTLNCREAPPPRTCPSPPQSPALNPRYRCALRCPRSPDVPRPRPLEGPGVRDRRLEIEPAVDQHHRECPPAREHLLAIRSVRQPRVMGIAMRHDPARTPAAYRGSLNRGAPALAQPAATPA